MKPRFGGRTESKKLGNGWIDFGGQWFGFKNPEINKLCKELDILTYKQFYEGKAIFDCFENGEDIKCFYEDSMDLNDMGVGNINEALKLIDILISTLNFENIELNDRNLLMELEKQSLDDWFKNNGFNNGLKIGLSVDSKDVSFLHFLKYIKSCGGSFENLFLSSSVDDCLECDKVIGGIQKISERMASIIGNCKLKSIVKIIDQTNNDYINIITESNENYHCKDVIVTVPPTLLNSISFKPELPLKRIKINNETIMGNAIKIIIEYETTFWREKGYNGKCMSYDGPILISYDNCTNDLKFKSIIGFIVGKESCNKYRLKSKKERINEILNQYSKYWGLEALKPLNIFEKDWSDEKFSGGCYSGINKPGDAISTCNSYYEKSFGNIHWAGSETSSKWNGHMEGAIISSNRVVSEIILKYKNK
ncbi:hypothetical protein ACTA71_010827 [Dictyostelium dimigraforme]